MLGMEALDTCSLLSHHHSLLHYRSLVRFYFRKFHPSLSICINWNTNMKRIVLKILDLRRLGFTYAPGAGFGAGSAQAMLSDDF